MNYLHTMHKPVAWKSAASPGRKMRLSPTHRRYLGGGHTLCGVKIPERTVIYNTGAEDCANCHARVTAKQPQKSKRGAITHEEVTAAIKAFLANGGVIQKYAPTPAVPWTAFDALEA